MLYLPFEHTSMIQIVVASIIKWFADPNLLVGRERFASLSPAWLTACCATTGVSLHRTALLGGTNALLSVSQCFLSKLYSATPCNLSVLNICSYLGLHCVFHPGDFDSSCVLISSRIQGKRICNHWWFSMTWITTLSICCLTMKENWSGVVRAAA